MPYFTTTVTATAGLAQDTAFASLVPGAAADFHITSVILGVNAGSATITDFDVLVGLNRATARGTSSATATINKADINSGGSVITAVDTAWSVAPTLAATDGWQFPFNVRGGFAQNYDLKDILSNVGTANPLVFVNRKAAVPANHSIVLTVGWLE